MTDTLNMGHEIVKGTKDVFSTMLMVDLTNEDIIENKKIPINSNITSMIGLGGGVKGVLAIHCPEDVARKITGAFLGMEVDELNEDVKDAIGEIANMVAGNLKVACSGADINVELAIPTSIVGNSFAISGIADARRVIVPLKMENDLFWIELMYLLNI